jgi:hypothetical protein
MGELGWRLCEANFSAFAGTSFVHGKGRGTGVFEKLEIKPGSLSWKAGPSDQNVNVIATTSRALAANIRMATASLRRIIPGITVHPRGQG